MPTWPELIASGPVVAARNDLDELLAQSHKTRLIDSVHNHPGEQGSQATPLQGSYRILVDEAAPNAVGQAVHEICHAILMERGYFIAQYPNNTPVPPAMADHLRDAFSNAVLHAEVFRLMQGFGVNMEEYFQHKSDGMLQTLAANQHQPANHVNRQQDILVFFDAYVMGPPGQQVRDGLNNFFPESHARCEALRAAIPAGGLVTWQAADAFGITFRNGLAEYCEALHLDPIFAAFWNSLVLCRPQDMFPNPPAASVWPRLWKVLLVVLGAIIIVGGVLLWVLTSQ